jgi:hypothetical protein
MREAFEIGWLAAHLYCKGFKPSIFNIDDVIFLTPVEIGSVIKITGIIL